MASNHRGFRRSPEKHDFDYNPNAATTSAGWVMCR